MTLDPSLGVTGARGCDTTTPRPESHPAWVDSLVADIWLSLGPLFGVPPPSGAWGPCEDA